MTEAQRLRVAFWAGWADRFHQTDSRLDLALNAIDMRPAALATITNLITGTPPGLLAILDDLDARIRVAHKRLKALKVGSIELSGRGEIDMLRGEGRRYVLQLCTLCGIERRNDVFSPGGAGAFAGAGGCGNFVGK